MKWRHYRDFLFSLVKFTIFEIRNCVNRQSARDNTRYEMSERNACTRKTKAEPILYCGRVIYMALRREKGKKGKIQRTKKRTATLLYVPTGPECQLLQRWMYTLRMTFSSINQPGCVVNCTIVINQTISGRP